MLLGQTPFHGKSPSETLLAHVHQPLPLPRTVDPDVDPRVEAALVKALAKDSDDRYQSPTEMMQGLGLVVSASDAEPETQDTIEGPPAPSPEIESEAGGDQAEQVLRSGISLDQSRVLAMRTAGETPGVFGRKFTGVPMAFEVVGEEETEGHYNITLSFRPQGTFAATPGQEQFFIDKEGSVVHRQVLELPAAESARRIPVVPVVAGLAAVATAAVIGFVVVQQVGGEGDGIEVPTAGPAAAPTSQPAPETTQAVPAPAAPAAAAPLVAPAVAETVAPRGGGTAVIWDDDALSDAITYSMTGMAPPD